MVNVKKLLRSLRPYKKPSWASLCVKAYQDTQGRVYYKYNDELDMCVIRKGEIDKCLMELKYGSDYLDIMNGIIKSANQFDRHGRATPDLIGISYLAQEMIDRDSMLLIPDIMMRICANALVREDENPHIVDQEILVEKINTFKSEIGHGGLHDFFHAGGLLKLVGLSNISATALTRLMTDSKTQLQKTKQNLSFILEQQ